MKADYNSQDHATPQARLAVERRLLAEEFPAVQPTPGDIARHSESWVRMWLDMSYVVFSECGTMYARRGLTDDGQMIWLVRELNHPLAFHAVAHDPQKAFERALSAWQRCDELRDKRGEIRKLVRALLLGRERFDVTLEDAAASPLSAVEVRSFMARMGLSRRRYVSGRVAALISLIEPQVGFVIWTAFLRHTQRRRESDEVWSGQPAQG